MGIPLTRRYGVNMSMPKKDTTFGNIELNGDIYKIFSRPLNEESAEKVAQYKKEFGGFSSAPWISDNYSWLIKENKLYLNEVTIGMGSIRNLMPNIFGVDELFAYWQNEEIEALVSKEEFDLEDKPKLKLVKMKTKILSFKDGELQSTTDATKELTMKKTLVDLGLIEE
jgi:hypothetical protein